MEQSTWADIRTAMAAAPYPVRALPADPRRSAAWLPPPWTASGRILATVSRKAVPLAGLVEFHQAMARRLGSPG